MAFCGNCGAPLGEGAAFCGKCGTKAGEVSHEAGALAGVLPGARKKSPWQYFVGVFAKYGVFYGRARRAEYWWYTLFAFLVSLGTIIVDEILDLEISDSQGVVNLLWGLVTFVPGLAVAVRRMHDCDKSGWYILIPIYGWIVLPCTEGTRGPNKYGPDSRLEG